MILLIDNYDSFTYNLYQYIGEINEDVKVIRNDAVTPDELKQMELEGIILSPGPGVPENAGICVDVIEPSAEKFRFWDLSCTPSHRYAYGGNVIRAETVKHGKTSMIEHRDDKLFEGTQNPLKVMRYHLLVVEEQNLRKCSR